MATRNSLQPGQPSEANDAAGAVLSSGDVVVKALRIGLNSNTGAGCDDCYLLHLVAHGPVSLQHIPARNQACDSMSSVRLFAVNRTFFKFTITPAGKICEASSAAPLQPRF
jgi:hypothetical protein